MVPLLSLWMPILVAAVLVFVGSSVIHMFLTYHQSDYAKVPDEERMRAVMTEMGLTPGNYVVPWAQGMDAMKDPAYQEKMSKGPIAFMTVAPPGLNFMGPTLVQWFFFLILVSLFVAYVTGRALEPGAAYLDVFQISGATAFMAYAFGGWPESIWYKRPWSVTFKNTFDSLVYGLLTAGAFGWLWPA